MDWQPIETAPKDGADILLGAFYDSGHWDVVLGRWQSWRRLPGWPPCGRTYPTHWMPLPAPPTIARARG